MSWIDNTSDYFNNMTFTSDEGARLDLFITAGQAAIEKYLGRTIASTEHDEILTAKQDGDMILGSFPIISIARVLPDSVKTLTIQNTTATHASFSITASGVSLVHYSSGVRANNSETFADNATLTDMATAITAVGSGWTSSAESAYGSYPSSDLVFGQFGDCTDSRGVYSWDDGPQRFEANTDLGVVAGQFTNGQRVRVIYTAGFATVPEDLQKVLADLALNAYDETKAGGATSESLGEYSYSLASMSERIGRLGVTNKTILSQYKDRRV